MMAVIALRSSMRAAMRSRLSAPSPAPSPAGLTRSLCHPEGLAKSFCMEPVEETMSSKDKFLSPPSSATSNSVDIAPGIYKAILIGKVGQPPTVKTLSSGAEVVTFPLGTGGLRNHRRALEGESPQAYAQRSFVQWHRICVFKPTLVTLAMQIKKGMNVYVEGNIETRVYKDTVSGTFKRLREISIRQHGRLYMMGTKPLLPSEVKE
ncbi:single-stranded DNA-binding protein, mitochondrial-like isoform X1 [Selaginella moellendorffii]|uniref:single-stranded DNA-binding protein, mitochondrial-like isoform X1 n=1 Tax=Selaginella moellendorffii TaxID=88036 RepID=UPI000D1CC0CA|nr:single-stranded DNA-binding protein, mitochondrial-like isoform X1 [Selaginella moellendorffii]|eukprot:XP_024527515.1 single-stranded DNA-binding protein, mitochondrial-like isoform X1 [Selaginella moellendorffii]